MPATDSQGRRVASLADQANYNSTNPAEQDNAEKDIYLREVQARDLVEYGMIPVCFENIKLPALFNFFKLLGYVNAVCFYKILIK